MHELELIIASARSVLSEAIAASGTTFRDHRLSDGRSGDFQSFLKVYARNNEACRSCNLPIKRIIQAQRSTFYCPNCQTTGRHRIRA